MSSSTMLRDAVDATGREIAKLEGERVQAERDIAIATAVERARAEVKLRAVKSALADAHKKLDVQLGDIVKDADEHIASVKAKAKTAKGEATQRLQSAAVHLEQKRNALAAKVATLKQTPAGKEWSAIKAELDASVDELRKLQQGDAAGVT